MIWEEGLYMGKTKTVQLYVEGKSDQTFFEGTKFREFLALSGYSVKIKNLKTKGNVLSNFEKFLKIYKHGITASLLIYDKDCTEFDTSRIEAIIKNYTNVFHCVSIQELEAWFLADHIEVARINKAIKLSKDTQVIVNPKSVLKHLFMDAGKGFKNELGFAEHFSDKINLSEARTHNKSLDKFLKLFETNFKAA